MKKLIAIALAVVMLIGAMVPMTLVSFAAENENVTYADKELALAEGKDFAFYVQTRDAAEGFKDVRVIILAKREWLESVKSLHVNLTFTNGTTPVTSKDLAVQYAYEKVTAGTDRYVAAEGLAMFGWIVTNVPEAYADLTNNAPKASITTDSASNLEIPSTPVDSKVTLNAVDGVLGGDAAISNNAPYVTMTDGREGNNPGSVTFTLDGNYEGLWKLDVYSFGVDADRQWTVNVNGKAQTFNAINTGSWEDISTAAPWAIYAELKNGENTIVVTCPTQYSAHLTKIVMSKEAYVEKVDSTFTLSAYDDGVISGIATKNKNDSGTYVNGLLTSRPSSLSFFLNGNYEGVWRLDVYSILWGSDRDWTVTVNGKAQTFTAIGVETWDDVSKAAPVTIYAELKNGLNTIEITSPTEASPHLVKVDMEKMDKIPTAIPGTSITTISGPKFGETDEAGNVVVNGEGTQTLFDGNYGTKLCANGTKADGTEQYKVPIVLKFDEAKKLTGMSIYNANDNATNNDRTVVYVKIWVSDDGENWGDAPAFVIDDQTPRSEISANYLHRYFSFGKTIEAKYVKLEVVNDGMYQMSEVVFYQ